MNTRKAKAHTVRARKTARKELGTAKRRLDAIGKALVERSGEIARWFGHTVETVRANLATFGRSTARTATAVREELKDDVAGVKKRLAAEKKAAPARKRATGKTAKKARATRKPVARRKAPARRRAAAAGAPAKRTAARKKAAGAAK